MEVNQTVTIKDIENLSEEEVLALIDLGIFLTPVIESIEEAHFYNEFDFIQLGTLGFYQVWYVENGLICLESSFGHGKEDKILCSEATVVKL